MRRMLIAVAALVALTGCTALPLGGGGQASDGPPARGLLIQEARLENRLIPQDGGTELIVRVANTQPAPVRNVSINITNHGDIEVELDRRRSGDKCPRIYHRRNTSISGAVQGIPTELLCVWRLNGTKDAGTSSAVPADPGTYPVTVSAAYTSTLTMQQQSPKITFDPRQQVAAAGTVRTYGNGEVSLSVSAPPRLPADTSEVEVTATVENIGAGELTRINPSSHAGSWLPRGTSCGDRCAILSLSGSFMDRFVDSFGIGGDVSNPEARCRVVRFLEGEQSAETTCRFTGGLEQTGQVVTHNLRASVTYRYQRQAETPLEVVEQN